MKIGIVQVALSHGGAEMVGVMLANGFHNHGHNVLVLTDLNEPIDFELDNNIRTIGILNNRNGNKFDRWVKAIYSIRKIIKKEKPDVLIGIMGLCTLVTYIACLGLKIPIVMTEHNAFERPQTSPMPISVKFFKFWINRLYKHITVLTNADKIAIGKRLKNITVMPNPLLLSPVNNIPPKKKTILAAGRVDSWYVKGFDILIKAWSLIYKKYPDWNLQIAGICHHPENYSEIPKLIKKYEIEERTHLLGFRSDVEQLYKDSEIFVLSSRYEGFGLVLIEAMSQGCAPIACDFKGRQKEIIGDPPKSSLNMEDFQKDGIEICENGILCEPDNVEALAKAIEKMIKDEDYRYQVQKNAVERSKYYSLDNTINRWENYLNSIVFNNG